MIFIQNEIPKYFSTEGFYVHVQHRISQTGKTPDIALVSLDIDNFNYINDLFSYEIGDAVLKIIARRFSEKLTAEEGFTNIHGDNFILCLTGSSPASVMHRLSELTTFGDEFSHILPGGYNLVFSGGVLMVQDTTLPIPALLDKANYARKRAKSGDSTTFHMYDAAIDDRVKWEKTIAFMMESALSNGEIEMYLQPKALIHSGQIMGAEAFARWNSKKYGMIYPDHFINIMERTGFVRQLDFFILAEACRFLKKSRDEGKIVLPISVNFSKAHLNSKDLVEQIFETVNGLGIPTNLIEIEFTESLTAAGFERLAKIVTDLKLLGFTVALDDFGTACSSLSYLKDLPLDVIKIDKSFLDTTRNSEKGKLILSKVVEIVKSMRMVSVIEGVETSEQVGFLQKLSCDIGQGYFYAKPMPVKEYEAFINSAVVLADTKAYLAEQQALAEKTYLDVIPQEFQMNTWELYVLGKNIDMGLMKGYLDEEVTVQYINDRALEYLGYNRREFREIFHNGMMGFVHPDDVEMMRQHSKQLISEGKPIKFTTRAVDKSGNTIILQGRSSFVVDSHGRPIGIHAFQDVTEDIAQSEALHSYLESTIAELEHTVQSLRMSEQRQRITLSQSDDIVFEWDFATDVITFSNEYETLFGNLPITTAITTNEVLRQRIHPEDLEVFEQWVTATYCKNGTTEAVFRIKSVSDSYIRVRCRSTALCDDFGVATKTIGAFSDMDKVGK